MKKIFLLMGIMTLLLAGGCDENKDVLIADVDDITLNELSLDMFTHKIPEGGFQSGIVRFNTRKYNDGTYGGFAYSNRSNRSFTWSGSQQALDSNMYSVFTSKPNYTEVYAVGCVKDEEAFLTLEYPAVVEHILVANTTYAYLSMFYDNPFGTAENPEINPNIPSKPKGIWYTYVDGARKFTAANKDYFKLIVKGYEGTTAKGTVEYYLACKEGASAEHPKWDFVRNEWVKVNLTSLGKVDKLVFELESSDVDPGGKMLTPPYFCLDGIRIKK